MLRLSRRCSRFCCRFALYSLITPSRIYEAWALLSCSAGPTSMTGSEASRPRSTGEVRQPELLRLGDVPGGFNEFTVAFHNLRMGKTAKCAMGKTMMAMKPAVPNTHAKMMPLSLLIG